jgi:hypothetical protein
MAKAKDQGTKPLLEFEIVDEMMAKKGHSNVYQVGPPTGIVVRSS